MGERDGGIRAADLIFSDQIVSDFARSRGSAGGLWAEGYTQAELDHAQELFGLVFPPDLVGLFRDRRPVQGWDWRSDHAEIRHMLAWPLEGLRFDVEHNDLWRPEWGARPEVEPERTEILRGIVARAPRLIPLVAHRYLPAEPHEPGNPVFSIYQSDIVIYGADLWDYVEREFGSESSDVTPPVKHIRFWSDFVG